MTKAATTTFRIEAIPPDALDRIRSTGQDDVGNPVETRIDDDGGDPLRCCLRPSEPGERIALIAYRPSGRPGPYAEVGPVFIHADSCWGYDAVGEYPTGYRDWPTMVFRPYRYDGTMAYPALAMVDGAEAEQAIVRTFGDPEIEVIHARNVLAGCFMFAIHRQEGVAPC